MYRVAVELVGPYRIYLPERFFKVNSLSKSSLVRAVPYIPEEQKANPPHTKIEITHDIFGYAGRTAFTVIHNEAVDIDSEDWKKEIVEKTDYWWGLSIEAINRVLSVYRDKDVTRDGKESYHIVPLVMGDFMKHQITVVDEHFNKVPKFAIYLTAPVGVAQGSAVDRSPKVISDIEDALKGTVAIPTWSELLSSAKNHAWRGMYRLAPVEANTSFESFISIALMNVAPHLTLPTTATLYTKMTELDKALQTKSANAGKTHSSWFSAPPDGWKTLTQTDLCAWHSECYMLRNKVIHEGYNTVTSGEAEKSIDATLKAQSFIRREVRKA